MPITIYGASDDLIEVDGDVKDEFYLPGSDSADVILTAPDGATLIVNVGFCDRNVDGWHVALESHGPHTPSWPVTFHPREHDPESEDPAVTIDAPAGTTVGCPADPQG